MGPDEGAMTHMTCGYKGSVSGQPIGWPSEITDRISAGRFTLIDALKSIPGWAIRRRSWPAGWCIEASPSYPPGRTIVVVGDRCNDRYGYTITLAGPGFSVSDWCPTVDDIAATDWEQVRPRGK
jgi:hypothetical protein